MTSFARIDGHPEYILTSDGEVYGPKGLKPAHKTVGDRYRGVSIDGTTYYLHRLVAQTFLANPESKPDVAHWDGDGTNNSVHNLRWASESENMLDKKRHGTLVEGEAHHNRRLSEEDVLRIRELRAEGVHVDEVAAMFGVSRWTVYDAASTKRTWKSVVTV